MTIHNDPTLNTYIEHDRQYREVQRLLNELYRTYYRADNNVARHRQDIEAALERLMVAYDTYLD